MNLKKIPFIFGYFCTWGFMQVIVYYFIMSQKSQIISDFSKSWVPQEILLLIMLFTFIVGGLSLIWVLPYIIWNELYRMVIKK